MIEIIILLF